MVLQIKMFMAPGQPLVSYRASEGEQAQQLEELKNSHS